MLKHVLSPSHHTSTLHTWHIHTTHASRVVTAQCHQPDTGARCPPTDVHMSPRRLASPTQTETERTQNSSRLVSRASSRPLARLAQPTLGSAHPSIGLAPRNTRWPHCTCATRKRSPATALIHTRAMRPPGAIKRLAGHAGGAHLRHTCAWLAGPNGHYRIARCGSCHYHYPHLHPRLPPQDALDPAPPRPSAFCPIYQPPP